MSQEIAFTVDELPTSPMSPRWEEPRRSAPSTRERPLQVIGLGTSNQALGQWMKKLTLQFCGLIRSNPTLCTVNDFLADWCINSTDDSNISTLHPFVVEWFSESNAIEACLKLEGYRKDLIKLLLAYGLQVNDRAIGPLMDKTLETQDTELLEWIIEHKQWEINRPVPGRGPPALGCLVSNDALVRWCFAHGADPNALSSDPKYTILHEAARRASLSTITLIIEAGGDVSPASPSAGLLGYAASTHSASHDRIPVMQYLLDHGAGIDLLRGANIDWNGDVSGDQQVWGRMNALHQSVQSGKKDLVEFLLGRGADIDIKAWGLDTRYKDTSVEDLARICGHEDILESLENHRRNTSYCS